MDFGDVYDSLNEAQRQAVDQIDGPLLVIAGPGTGKTQLLSARVANILKQTDTLPQNILCLTFTENGAINMRERLTKFIGQKAYDVHIGTYHAFGSDIIGRYREYFPELNLETPIDELGQYQIMTKLVEQMSYLNPLKHTRNIKDLIGTISEIKRALLTSDDLRMVADENLKFIQSMNSELQEIFKDFTKMGKVDNTIGYFTKTLDSLSARRPQKSVCKYGSLASLMTDDLVDAIELVPTENTKPLTAWKNKWLEKDSDNQFVVKGKRASQSIRALADLLDDYQTELASKSQYDFNDMILKAIHVLEDKPDLKYSLQEQYQYILLDEYQDTNAAQARLVNLLTDNPVNEGRPNIMAVGDDDQAIFAFQGAKMSNMLDFAKSYTDTRVISLSENYRSHGDIIDTASQISSQIEERLVDNFDDISKDLTASDKNLPDQAIIERRDFLSQPAEAGWIAERIKHLIHQDKVSPNEIAILAPKHKNLEPLIAYLNKLDIPLQYEKRENILDTPIIKQIITIAELITALNSNDERSANALWPEVLSFNFWNIATAKLWQISWQVSDSKGELNWSKVLIDDVELRPIAIYMKQLASIVDLAPMEAMLDLVIGSTELQIKDDTTTEFTSPLRAYYTDAANPALIYDTVSQLTVLRRHLRDHQSAAQDTLYLRDMLVFIDLYTQADQRMLNTSPYNQGNQSVQIMTAFKSKGLEFEHVFLVNCQDEMWGESASGGGSGVSLPANLEPIRHSGKSADEQLRLLFVAMTRAKVGLYMTSHLRTFSSKPTKRLKYLNEQEQDDGSFKSLVLPVKDQKIITSDTETASLEMLLTNWQDKHISGLSDTKLHDLLVSRLANYRLSPTHLNTFIDMEYGGPAKFLMNTLLRFPQAPSDSGIFGDAIHTSLEWMQNQLNSSDKLPTTTQIIDYFTKIMESQHLAPAETKRLIERGSHALEAYFVQRSDSFKTGDKAEYNFYNEGVTLGDAILNGKIDKLEIDTKDKTLKVVDYKTGKPHDKWDSSLKLHKYKQQLYCYQILLENSNTFKDYRVTSQRLDFIEPDSNGRIHSLELKFVQKEYDDTKKLIGIMWRLVQSLDLPDTSHYDASMVGTREFEKYLLNL